VNLGTAIRKPDFNDAVFLLAGHTDAKGGVEYNLTLSERRAEAVKKFLSEKFGIPAGNLVPIGYGKETPKNKADPFASENRRVQVVNLDGR
jgi:outer membrane protein OmpA-like peptidoglycan-associated protein